MNKQQIISRIEELKEYIINLQKQKSRGLDDIKGLNKPGLYFIYDTQEILVYIGSTHRPLCNRLRELRDQPKDHTFHSKQVRDAIERKLKRRIKKYDAKKLSKFSGHEMLSIEDFKQILENTKQLISRNFKHRTLELENTAENLKKATAIEHFAISVFQPIWNDKVDRVTSEFENIELFK